MKHIYLDTNIIVDIFAARAPHDIAAIELYRLAKDNKIKIYISAESFTTIYYILRINKNKPLSSADYRSNLPSISSWLSHKNELEQIPKEILFN